MNLHNIKEGQVFKNYKELCEALEEPVKYGNSKKAQLKDWENYFIYNRSGRKFIIQKLVHNVQYISEVELVDQYGTKLQQEKYKENPKSITQYRNTLLKEAGRFYDIEYNKEIKKYEIYNVYNFPIPKKMVYMKKGLYQYIIPLLLLKLKNESDENNKLLLSTDRLARKIYMHNDNYNELKFHKNIACSDNVQSQNLSVDKYMFNFNLDSFYDYFKKADQSISYHIEHALAMLQDIGVIKNNKTTMIIYADKLEDTDKEQIYYDTDRTFMFRKRKRTKHRKATDEEIKDNLIMQQEADTEAGLNVKERGVKDRYYSSYSKDWMEKYENKLIEYSKNLDYDVLGFTDYYEVYAGKLDECDECLKYFECTDEDTLIGNFNQKFYDSIIEKTTRKIEKGDNVCLDDYINLAGITIFKDIPLVHEIIENNPEEIRVTVIEY